MLGIVTFFFVSLIYSFYLLSISMLLMGLYAAITAWLKHGIGFVRYFVTFWTYPIWWVVTLHFILVLLTGYYSDDTAFWLTRLRIKLPFLLMPLAFFIMPTMRRQVYLSSFALLALVTFVSTAPVCVQLLSDFQNSLATIAQGGSVETPVSHIRYSLMLALGALSAVVLWHRQFVLRFSWEPLVYLALAVYLFFFIHLLAVRSGLLVLYVGLLVFACIGMVKNIRRKACAIALVLLCLSPPIILTLSPSFRAKISYVKEDLRQYQQRNWNAFSDAERLLSVEGGLVLALRHPWFGVGAGDLKSQMKKLFLDRFDKTTFLLPHNQYISILAGCGILGLIIFLAALFFPFLRFLSDPFCLALYVVVLLSMMVENTLETSVGVAIYCLPLCIILNRHKTNLAQFKLTGPAAPEESA